MPLEQITAEDASTLTRNNESGFIDKVIPNPENPNAFNSEGDPFIKGRVTTLRYPEIGDKFASRYSQKGTIGFLYRSYDMPMTCDGMTPSIIMNPHGIPSRMTVGKSLETLSGRVAVTVGQLQDATPFSPVQFDEYCKVLESYGMNKYGNEVMYNGQTGQMFEVELFYGPTYYQRLKHMVADKIHCLKMDTEVPTESGWKFYEQLTMNDKIATLKDNELVYEKPIELLYYPEYEGDMYYIKNQLIDLAVTGNHRMWVFENGKDYAFELAKDIVGQQIRYKKNAEWNATDSTSEFIGNGEHLPEGVWKSAKNKPEHS